MNLTNKRIISTCFSALLFSSFAPAIQADSDDDDYPNETATQIKLETALEHINLTKATEYYVDLEDDAETLVISFAQGVAGDALGDPDIYVRHEKHASPQKFDCISYNGTNSNEYCIIDEPEDGRYYIYVDAFEGSAVKDATLWASTKLFPGNETCEDGAVIRGQAMNEDDLEAACDIIDETHQIFFNMFKTVSPASMDPVVGDLNTKTGINILSSISNGAQWTDYLTSGDNSSGIYYETAPTEFYHRSTIWTFNPLEWTGGRTVYRSLGHEYIHALDGRYNKEGGYNRATGWWSEGLGEYLGSFHNLPYERFETTISSTQYTLAQIFDQHNNAGVPSPYSWGQLAVAFFIEEHPQEVNNMVGYMRAGNWTAWSELLNTWSVTYQDEFAVWTASKPRQQFENSAKTIKLGEYKLVEGRGGWLYSVEVPAGTDSLTVATTGGSGDIELMVSAGSVPHWSFDIKPDCAPYAEGNEEVCTFTDIKPGTYYITLDSYWSGSDILDLYLTACTGKDCSVKTPAAKPLEEVVAPVLPGKSLDKTFQSCDMVTSYTSGSSRNTNVSITNTTTENIKVYWVYGAQSRIYLERVYAEIAPGDTYNAKEFWAVKDRLAITDQNDKCLAVGEISRSDNHFTFSGAVAK